MDACTAQSVLALLSLTHISSEHSTKGLLADLSHWQAVSTGHSNVRGPSLCSATQLLSLVQAGMLPAVKFMQTIYTMRKITDHA